MGNATLIVLHEGYVIRNEPAPRAVGVLQSIFEVFRPIPFVRRLVPLGPEMFGKIGGFFGMKEFLGGFVEKFLKFKGRIPE